MRKGREAATAIRIFIVGLATILGLIFGGFAAGIVAFFFTALIAGISEESNRPDLQ